MFITGHFSGLLDPALCLLTDIIPIVEYCSPTSGEINRGGHLDLDQWDFLTSRLISTLSDRLRWPSRSFKISQVSRDLTDFLRFSPTLTNFSRFFYLKRPGKSRKTRDRASRHGPNFGTGRVALPDPDLSKSQDGHPDLDLDLTLYYPPRDISPIVGSYTPRR